MQQIETIKDLEQTANCNRMEYYFSAGKLYAKRGF